MQVLLWIDYYIDTNIIDTYSLLPKLIGETVGNKQIYSLPIQARRTYRGLPSYDKTYIHSHKYARSGSFVEKSEITAIVYRNPYYGTHLYDIDKVQQAVMNDENKIDVQASIQDILNSTII